MLLMTVAEMRDSAVDGNTEGAEVDNHWRAASIRAIFCGKIKKHRINKNCLQLAQKPAIDPSQLVQPINPATSNGGKDHACRGTCIPGEEPHPRRKCACPKGSPADTQATHEIRRSAQAKKLT